MKDYYQILRISRQASDEEIKRAYRRLALVFHPDKNRSAEASALFQEINEAHEILSDPAQRQRYDELLSGATVVLEAPPPQQWHRDPAYRRKQQPGYKPPPARPSERLLMMVHFLQYLRPISWAGLAWCAFLVFDYSLPFRVSEENVLAEANRDITWEMHHVPNVVVTDKGHQFPVSYEGAEFFPVGSKVEVVTSWVLHVLVVVKAKSGLYTIDNLASVYQNFMIVPVILFLLSVAGLLLKKGIEFRFNVAISICIVLVFNLIFLLFSIA
ncbi:MAG: J domain-containing protein [Cyclobacteriaceae bacterium]|nr:J domain-containing protein [Cyclobacteriaceae bacterium]